VSGAPDFDAFPIPFRAVATDLVSGEAVTLSRGDLAEAVRASMSVPGVFPPVELEGRLLADGLVVKNFPVDVALAWGADVVIGVNIPSPDLTAGEIDSLLAVSRRVLDLLTDQNIKPQLDLLREGDILIEPDLGDIGSADFDRMREAARMGEQAARALAPLLGRLSLSEEAYACLREDRCLPPRPTLPLAEVRVEGGTLVPASTIRAEMRTRPGKPLDLDLLRRDLTRLYATGDFETVDFRLLPAPEAAAGEPTGPILLVRVKERSWGPAYLRFGLGIDDDFAGGAPTPCGRGTCAPGWGQAEGSGGSILPWGGPEAPPPSSTSRWPPAPGSSSPPRPSSAPTT
jgi:NTE family protein